MKASKFSIFDINFESIIKSIPGYVYWKDLNSVYQGCNQKMAEDAGFNTPSKIIGKTDYDFVWGSLDAEQFIKDDQFVMQTKQTHIAKYLMPIKNIRNYNIIVRTEKNPLLDNDGNVIGILGVAMDISDSLTEMFSFLMDGSIVKTDSPKLSRIEYEVLYLLKMGKSAYEIANYMQIAENIKFSASTIIFIINQLCNKFGVQSIEKLIEQTLLHNSLHYFPENFKQILSQNY